MNFNLKDVCFFDCETTGVPAKGLKWDADFNQFPHVVQLAWSLGDKERSFIIKPDNYEIPPETTAIHGITTERAIAEGVPFAEVVDEFLADAAAARGAEVALFGHTHKPIALQKNGVFLFNPGSCGRCYTGPNTYGVMLLDKGRITSFAHKEVPQQ